MKAGSLLQLCALLIALCVTPSVVSAAARSELSTWLATEVVPPLQIKLARHPRYQDEPVRILERSHNGLSEAVATVLDLNLGPYASISASPVAADSISTGARSASIDELNCIASDRDGYRLEITSRTNGARDEVSVVLVEAQSNLNTANWQWRGRLSSAEKKALRKPAVQFQTGELSSPWQAQQFDAAARALTRQLVCDLRPQTSGTTTLSWPEDAGVPQAFADTFNASEHYIGAYRELDMLEGEAHYHLQARVQRFDDDIWQLWLIGRPGASGERGIQAVTYMHAPGLTAAAVSVAGGRRATSTSHQPPPRSIPAYRNPPQGAALDYLDLEFLDATQTERRGRKVELEISVRVQNRAKWPLEYSFTTSGGHFLNCEPQPAYYRHDAYGSLRGELAPGESRIQRLKVRRARHHPTPLYGTPRCAGFRDLEGFEDFIAHGHKVTDYVRWRP